MKNFTTYEQLYQQSIQDANALWEFGTDIHKAIIILLYNTNKKRHIKEVSHGTKS